MTGKRGSLLERFERFYIPEPNSGCWLWIGSLGAGGYAQLGGPNAVPIRAHRLSYQLFKGKIPRGFDVRHTCDVRCCVNPDHLLVGTRKQNMEDAVKRGRQAKGFMLPHTRLSDLDIAAIVADKRYNAEIAASYGVTPQYICVLKRSNGVYSEKPPQKGPGLTGERHPMVKLNRKQVEKIREMADCGARHSVIARKFKVTQTTIWSIVNRRTWK